jgi:hypothetical protein
MKNTHNRNVAVILSVDPGSRQNICNELAQNCHPDETEFPILCGKNGRILSLGDRDPSVPQDDSMCKFLIYCYI